MIQKTILVKATAAVMGAAVITGTVVAVNHLSKTKDSYRSILLYEIEGTAKVDRQGTGMMNGVENLYLESGDELTVEPESFTRLRLDDDKYVMVEENSALSIEAAGTKEDSRTTIHLTKGAIINEIQNPLSSGSTYEVTTPNSVMAVRGTTFRVEIYYDENGEAYTKVSVFDGEVASRLIFPDGTMDEEVVTSHGKEVIIHSNTDLTEYLGGIRDIDYEELPLSTLSFIAEIMDRGGLTEGITKEELGKLIQRKEGEGEGKAGKETVEETEEETRPESRETEETSTEPETIKEEESTEEKETQRPSGAKKPLESSAAETTQAAESPAAPAMMETTVSPAEIQTDESSQVKRGSGNRYDSSDDSDDSGSGGGSGGSGSWDTPTESSTESPAEVPTEPTTESTAEAPTEPTTEAPAKPVEHTVTFMYNGTVFGTQQVEDNGHATEPWLKPAAEGKWNFTFDNTAITADTEIQWITN